MSDDWRWTCTPPDAWTGETPGFAQQAEAERWLSDTWPELAESGVAAVTLVHGTTTVYGPMSLQELE